MGKKMARISTSRKMVRRDFSNNIRMMDKAMSIKTFLKLNKIDVSFDVMSSEREINGLARSMYVHPGGIWSIVIKSNKHETSHVRKFIVSESPINHLLPELRKAIKRRINKRRLELHPDKNRDKDPEKLNDEISLFTEHISTFINPPTEAAVTNLASNFSKRLFNTKEWAPITNLPEVLLEIRILIFKLDDIKAQLHERTLGKFDIRENTVMRALFCTIIVYFIEALWVYKWDDTVKNEYVKPIIKVFEDIAENGEPHDIYPVIDKLKEHVENLSKQFLSRIDKRMILDWGKYMSYLLEKLDIRVKHYNQMFADTLKHSRVYKKKTSRKRKKN